ncbi:MAG: tetratricopeptide repeat protein, partial [Candidatus Methylomirabilales bacterium]
HYAHNHYLQMASEMGLFGLLLLLALWGQLFWKGWKITRGLPPLSVERSLAFSLLAALLASALHAGIDFDGSYPAIALGVVLEAALLLSYSHQPSAISYQPLNARHPLPGMGNVECGMRNASIRNPHSEIRIPTRGKALAAILVLSLGVLAFVRFYAEVSLRWGKWAFQEGFMSEAEAAFRKVSRFYPFSYAAHYWLSLTFAEQGKGKEAVREAEAALRLNPEDGDAYHHLGRIYWRMGRLEEAERALAQAVKLEPSSNLRFYVELGALLLARGQQEEARRIYQRAVEVFRPEMVLSQNGRCLAPGDRYLLADVLEKLSQPSDPPTHPSPLKGEDEGGGKLAEKLREPDQRGICREGLKAGLTSPEATILTYWSRQPLDLRIMELVGGETQAWVVYEVTVGGRRLRLRDRLKLEDDGWQLAR